MSICPFLSFADFLLHPFRKPKRVRTAFSPGQLLKLEHAFESNQYVVGAERKALAQALNLSETQVSSISISHCDFILFFNSNETFLNNQCKSLNRFLFLFVVVFVDN